MLRGLEIRRYKGIKECVLDGLTDVNILIGRNNVGKSSVLEALYLASAAFKFKDPLDRGDKITHLLNRRGDRGLSWEKGKEVLWYGYDDDKEVEVVLKTIKNKIVKIVLWSSHNHPLVAIKVGAYTPVCFLCFRGFNPATKGWYPLASKDLEGTLEGDVPGFRSFVESTVLIDASLMRSIRCVEESLWPQLLMRRLDKLVVEVLKGGYDVEIEDLTYAPLYGTYQLMAKLPDTAVRVDDLGDGARYALVMVMAAALARNTAMLIEEPESHQHPGGLDKTVKMLLKLAKENKIQLFISTHSVELVRLLEARGQEVGLEVATFFLERDSEGRVSVRRVRPDDRRLLEDLGLDVRFLDLI